VSLLKDVTDTWWWIHAKNGIYCVRTAYLICTRYSLADTQLAFRHIWDKSIPPK
ncbi:hypothetical protein Ancab_008752, partial [Ancistrocladus abbreviatus]